MRRAPSKNLRASRHVVAGCGGRGRGSVADHSTAAATTATPSVVGATATTAWERWTRVAALAVASVNSALVRHQGCSRLTIALLHRRCHSHPRFPVSDDAAVALATTTPRRDDLATILAHYQLEVRALSTDGQYTPAAAGTPVQPQLAIPAGAGDSATATSSFFLRLSVIVEPALASKLEPELSRHVFISSAARWREYTAFYRRRIRSRMVIWK